MTAREDEILGMAALSAATDYAASAKDDPNARLIYMSQLYGLGLIGADEFSAALAAHLEDGG